MDGVDGRSEFEAVFAELYPAARALAFRVLGSMPAAEDAAAEAFVRAYVDWPRIGSLPHREAWIMRVTSNVAIDAARRRTPPVAPPALGSDADELVVLRSTLVAALAELPRRQREAVLLRHLAGYPASDVATAMGVSTNSVKKHLQRGLAHLRQRLAIEEGADLGLA